MILISSTDGKGVLHLGTGDNIKNHFEKSYISDVLGESPQIPIIKTGKEVKEKLQEKLVKVNSNISEIEEEIQERLEIANVIPTELVDDWERKDLEKDSLPRLISWDVIYGRRDIAEREADTLQREPEVTVLSDEQQKAAREYNRLVSKLVDCMLSRKRFETLINNIKDDQKITLTPNLASVLGF